MSAGVELGEIARIEIEIRENIFLPFPLNLPPQVDAYRHLLAGRSPPSVNKEYLPRAAEAKGHGAGPEVSVHPRSGRQSLPLSLQ